MKISRLASTIIFLSFAFLYTGCSSDESAIGNTVSNTTTTNTNAVATKDNVEELAAIVKMDAAPEEVTYVETNLNDQTGERSVPGPNEKKLVAVLKFSPEKAAQVAAQAEKYKPVVPAEMNAENWYPAELIAQSQLSGDETLKGITYAADDFFQTPYRNGKLTRINDTNYFILELTTF